jgi:hypothetical protein
VLPIENQVNPDHDQVQATRCSSMSAQVMVIRLEETTSSDPPERRLAFPLRSRIGTARLRAHARFSVTFSTYQKAPTVPS